MIKYFSWKNFLSFKDEGMISFEVDENAPKTGAFTKCADTRLSKIAAILGPNASGKTNVIKALDFIRYFIVNSFHDKNPGSPIYQPYMSNEDKSSFNVGFFINNLYYDYSFELNRQGVLLEKLQKISPKENVMIFKRKKQNFIETNFEDKKTEPLLKKNIHLTRANASIISTFAQINEPEMQKIKNFWEHQMSLEQPNPDLILELNKFSRKYQKDDDLLDQMKDILKNLDLGEHTLTLEKGQALDKHSKSIMITIPFMSRPDQQNNPFTLPLFAESHGTQNLFTKLYPILKSLKNKLLIVIDELELGIHPQAVSRILHLFTEQKNQGQILFTSHMSPILMDLNKYQVHLVKKTKDNKSSTYRLDQFEDIKDKDNLFKNYMSGVYGGFPDIDY